MWLGRVTYDHLLPLHKRQCLVTIIFTNLPSLHPFSFHEMIFILVYFKTCPKQLILNLLLIINVHIFINRTYQCMYNHHLTENIQLCNCIHIMIEMYLCKFDHTHHWTVHIHFLYKEVLLVETYLHDTPKKSLV